MEAIQKKVKEKLGKQLQDESFQLSDLDLNNLDNFIKKGLKCCHMLAKGKEADFVMELKWYNFDKKNFEEFDISKSTKEKELVVTPAFRLFKKYLVKGTYIAKDK